VKEHIKYFSLDKECIVLVAPDAGATKKTEKLANALQLPMIQGFKLRNTNTGELTGFGIAEAIPDNCRAIIVDDICDGGGTFEGLAGVIKEKNLEDTKIDLVVSHGIFKNGIFLKHITNITTTNSFKEFNPVHSQFQVVNVNRVF
jgi:ribose-phosphate pyrophosphokinase